MRWLKYKDFHIQRKCSYLFLVSVISGTQEGGYLKWENGTIIPSQQWKEEYRPWPQSDVDFITMT